MINWVFKSLQNQFLGKKTLCLLQMAIIFFKSKFTQNSLLKFFQRCNCSQVSSLYFINKETSFCCQVRAKVFSFKFTRNRNRWKMLRVINWGIEFSSANNAYQWCSSTYNLPHPVNLSASVFCIDLLAMHNILLLSSV